MNKFGTSSRFQLGSCDSRLQRIAPIVLRIKDHSIIKGHRNKEDQNLAFASGNSRLKWPDGKHNKVPSIAMDVQTYPVPDSEQALREEQLYLLGLYRAAGAENGILFRTGADWDQDGEIADNGFDDFFHVEVVE